MMKKIVAAVLSVAICGGMVLTARNMASALTDGSESMKGQTKYEDYEPDTASVAAAAYQLKTSSVNNSIEVPALGSAIALASVKALSEADGYNPFANKIVCNTYPYLNIRSSANIASGVVGRLMPASEGIILEKGDEWTLIRSGNIEGYVKNEFVVFDDEAFELAKELGTKTAVITEDTGLYNTNSDEAEKIADATKDSIYSVVSEVPTEEEKAADKMIAILNDNGETCYVDVKSVKIEFVLNQAVADVPAETPANNETAKVETSQKTETETQTQAPVQETVQQTAPTVNLSVDEQYLLACLIMAEAGAEPYEGQLGVANVVLNRMRSPYFPNTLYEVIYQTGQFAPTFNGALDRMMANGPSSSCVQAAANALAGVNNVGGCLYFMNGLPSWAHSGPTWIGHICFFN